MKNYLPALLILLVLALAATACCPCPPKPPVGLLPPAISMDEQMRRLADWSARLPGIKATTVLAGVRLEYRDDKGADHTLNTEGYLWIRQHTGSAAATADVLLLGKSINMNAFEAGRNPTNWWFAIRADTKTAWVGDANVPVDYARLGTKGEAAILRADLVPDLLGISKLPEYGAGGGQSRTAGTMMIVDDENATNDVYVGQMSGGGGGRPFLAREIMVDRYSGHVTEVRLYDPEGVVVVRSRLSEYKPVTYEEGTPRATVVPMFPRKLEVSFPARHMVVAMEFGDVVVSTGLEDSTFKMPSWRDMKVVPVE